MSCRFFSITDMVAYTATFIVVLFAFCSGQTLYKPANQRCGDDNQAYYCLGSYHFVDCATERIADCSEIQGDRDALCFSGGQDIEAACLSVPVTCSVPGKMKVPNDCVKYIDCVDIGDSTLETRAFTCLPGYEFSTNHSRCMPVNEAGCSVPPPAPTTTTVPPICITGEKKIHKLFCDQYYECTSASKFAKRFCPRSTPFFDQDSLVCMEYAECQNRTYPPSITTTTTVAPTTAACVVGSRSPSDANCRQYYECNYSNVKILKTCPFGMAFIADTNKCGENSGPEICGHRPFYDGPIKKFNYVFQRGI